MVTMIKDATGSQSVLQVRRVLDISDTIYLLEPDAAPLYTFVSKLNKSSTVNTTFQWLEDELRLSSLNFPICWNNLRAQETLS